MSIFAQMKLTVKVESASMKKVLIAYSKYGKWDFSASHIEHMNRGQY